MKSLAEYITESQLSQSLPLTPQEVSYNIANYYLDNIDELNWDKKQHFLNRLKLCEGYNNCLSKEDADFFAKKLIAEASNIYKYIIGEFNLETGFNKLIVSKYDTLENERKKLVKKSLESIDAKDWKRLLLLGLLSERLSILFRMGYFEKFESKSIYNNIRDLYESWTSKIENLIFNESFDLICNIPTNIVNMLYYTKTVCKYMHVQCGLDRTISAVRSNIITEFNNVDKKDNIKLLNILYGLAHVIIGSSEFYTTPVTQANFQSEAACIEKALKGQLSLLTPDIICEGSLCLALLDSHFYNSILRRTTEYLVKQFKQSKSNILYNFKENKNDLEINEHINILFILLNNYYNYTKK